MHRRDAGSGDVGMNRGVRLDIIKCLIGLSSPYYRPPGRDIGQAIIQTWNKKYGSVIPSNKLVEAPHGLGRAMDLITSCVELYSPRGCSQASFHDPRTDFEVQAAERQSGSAHATGDRHGHSPIL